MKKYSLSKIIFIALGIGSLIFFFDTLFSDKEQEYSFLTIPTNKGINLIILLILAILLIISGLKLKSR